MSCTKSFILRALFLSFLALNAWNTLKNFEDHHETFVKEHNAFKQTLETRTGMQVPSEVCAAFDQHSENIAKYLLWGTLALSLASLLLSGCLTWTVGAIYLTKTIMSLNVAGFNCQTPLAQWESLAFAVAIFMGSVAMSCTGKSGKCAKKTKNVQKKAQTANVQKSNKNKKRKRD